MPRRVTVTVPVPKCVPVVTVVTVLGSAISQNDRYAQRTGLAFVVRNAEDDLVHDFSLRMGLT